VESRGARPLEKKAITIKKHMIGTERDRQKLELRRERGPRRHRGTHPDSKKKRNSDNGKKKGGRKGKKDRPLVQTDSLVRRAGGLAKAFCPEKKKKKS